MAGHLPVTRPPRGTLRRSLHACTAEGVVAELAGACTGGAALTGWALELGCGPAVIGLLGALPFLAQVLQLPAARLVHRYGARRVALAAVAVSRQAFLPLALLPFLPGGGSLPGGGGRVPELLLVGVAAVLHGFGMICNNGWVTWVGELVPPRLRGRYFGRRAAITTAAAGLAALATGALLDAAPPASGSARPVLAALAAASCLAGAAGTWIMARQHGGAPRRAGPVRTGGGAFTAVLRAAAPRRLAAFLALSGAASGLAVPFVGVFLVRDRRLGFAFLAAHGLAGAVARLLAAPRWGRLVDRPGGARAALAASAGLLVASPLLWLAAARGGPALLLAEAVLGGIGAAGVQVAGLALPLALAPPAERPSWHAVFQLSGGLAFGLGTIASTLLAGSAVAAALPLAALAGPLTLPFAGCAALRLATAGAALRLVEPARGPQSP